MGESSKYLVVDIGGTKIRSALWDGFCLSEVSSIETPKVTAEIFLKTLVDHLHSKNLEVPISGIGVSTAGPVDVVDGMILNPANLGNGDDSWKKFAIKNGIEEAIQLPVSLDNDAAMTAFGHYHHSEKQRLKDFVVLTIGTGIGVSAIVNGDLVRAGQSMHPEFGHFLIADKPSDEHETPFANYPTLESYLSGFHFSNRVGNKLGRSIDGGELIRLSESRDEIVMEMWDSYSRRMAVAMSNLYLVYFPLKIVLAGGFALVASPFFLQKTQSYLSEILQGRVDAGMPLPAIEISAIHDELPLLGAGYKIQKTVESI